MLDLLCRPKPKPKPSRSRSRNLTQTLPLTCAGFPSSFLWFERFKWLLSGMIDAKRPMDDVALSFDTPQELGLGLGLGLG